MTYTKPITIRCCDTCGATATHEVIDNGNTVGYYDQEHARELAATLNGAETGEVR